MPQMAGLAARSATSERLGGRSKPSLGRRFSLASVAFLLIGLVIVSAGPQVPTAAAAANPTKTEHGLGWNPTPGLTPGISASAAALAQGTAIPASVDLSAWSPPVGSQGAVNACTSWATGYYFRYWLRNRTLGETSTFAPMYLYSQIYAATGVDNGSTFPQNFDILETQGIAHASDYPQGPLDYWTPPTAAERKAAAPYAVASDNLIFAGPNSGNRAAIEASLAAGRPVVISLPVYDNFYDLAAGSSFVDLPSAGDGLHGNHAVFAAKYDAAGLWIENSWGTDWGKNGWAELSWAFVNQYAKEGWSMVDTSQPNAAYHSIASWGRDDYAQTDSPTGTADFTAISAGYYHSLALKSNGRVVAWGSNANYRSTVPFAALTGVTAIAAGGYQSMALKSNGTVVAWGANSYGEGGVPAGLSGVTAIAAGFQHDLALKADHTVVAWGDGAYGQLAIPAGLSGVTAIAAGGFHSLALKSDGKVVAWGNDYYGQTKVPAGLSGVIAVAAGAYYSLALKGDGTVIGWGANDYGQTNIPPGLTGVSAITAGSNHAFALKPNGTLVGWGRNDYGETVRPSGTARIDAISAGGDFSVALLSVSGLSLSGFPSPSVVGSAHNLTVTARDASGNTATSYRGKVHFTSTDAAATLPADYTFTAGDAGKHTFSVTLKTVGTRSITATDTAFSSIKGTQSGIVVAAAPTGTTYHAIARPGSWTPAPTAGVVVNMGLSGTFKAGTVRTFKVAGAKYVGGGTKIAVPTNATAITGNLTIVTETASGVIALGPTMTATGAVTTINFTKGDIRANNVTVGLGPSGTLQAVYRATSRRHDQSHLRCDRLLHPRYDRRDIPRSRSRSCPRLPTHNIGPQEHRSSG